MARPSFPPHVYDDYRVTRQRIAAFGNAPREEQLVALAFLRGRSAFHFAETVAPISSLILAMAAIVLTVISFRTGGAPSASTSTFVLVFGLMSIGMTALTLVMIFDNRAGFRAQARARMWLGFYEEELVRRSTETGWRARQWRRSHPVDY